MFCQQAPLIFGDLDAATSWDLVIDSEPSLTAVVSGAELDEALAAVGELAELKSPWLMSHAQEVAELATEVGKSGGLAQADATGLAAAARSRQMTGPRRTYRTTSSTWPTVLPPPAGWPGPAD